jgi:uncharacterized protein HemX
VNGDPLDSGTILGGISIAVTLLLGLLVFITNRRANRTGEKKLTLEEQQVEDQRHRSISEERRKELDRLYERVDKLETTVAELQKRDEQKQKTIDEQADKIDDQADELERTNRVLSEVRRLFVKYTARVERAWKEGHTTMPTLTVEEKSLLEDTLTRAEVQRITQKAETP